MFSSGQKFYVFFDILKYFYKKSYPKLMINPILNKDFFFSIFYLKICPRELDFTFTCPPPASVPTVPVSSVTFAPPPLPLSMNPTLSLNMYSIDNSQPSQVSQIISPSHSPSSPLSLLEYRDSPTADELDVPEFFQYSKEKYESAKSGCKRRRKSTRDEQCETSSMDGGDDVDDNVRQVSISKFSWT